jgi:hypothetical protein
LSSAGNCGDATAADTAGTQVGVGVTAARGLADGALAHPMDASRAPLAATVVTICDTI